jgi:hypothetical protein
MRETSLGDYAPNAAELLNRLSTRLKRHMVITDAQADAIALWILHTYVYQRFDHTPRLAIISPQKRCGKSTLLELLELVCCNPLHTDSTSEAALYRTVDSQGAVTLLVDEMDSFMMNQSGVGNVLNSGFKFSGTTMRCVKANDDHAPKRFRTFCPIALASIGDLSDTVMDRSVVIRLRRKTDQETVERIRPHRDSIKQDGEAIAAWAKDVDLSQYLDPSMPDDLGDRQADISVVLLALANLAGGEWPERARVALLDLFKSAEEESQGAMLLADIRSIFVETGAPKMSSEAICMGLAKFEHRPWAEFRGGAALSKPQLAHLLAPFGIGPINMRNGQDVVKGYERAAFADAWLRYLPPEAEEEGANVAT